MNNYTEYKFAGKHRAIKFEFEGRAAEVAFPETMTDGMAWCFKTVYSNAFPALESKLIEAGMGRAYVDNANRWGTNDELALKARFAKFLSEEFGFGAKCVPIGYSCGGIVAVKFAAYYPELVSCVHLDAPVINFMSCPVKFGHDNFSPDGDATLELLGALGLTLTQLTAYRDAPIDRLDDLARYRVPCSLVYGDADTVVYCDENAALVEETYRRFGVPFYCERVHGRGHHPHEAVEMDKVVEFIMRHCK